MRKVIFFFAIVTLLGVSVHPAYADEQSYAPTADTTLKLSSPTTSFGSDTTLDALYDSGTDPAAVPHDVQESYLKFDINSIPKGMYITAAKLALTGSGASNSGYGDVRLRQVTGPWDESTTWSNRPNVAAGSAANIEINNNTFPSSVDITQLVQEWYIKSVPNYGLMMRVFGDTGYETGLYDYEDVHISSREGANPPKLTITYSATPPTPTPAPTVPAGEPGTPTLSPNQLQGNVTSPGINASSAPNSPATPAPSALIADEPIAACLSDIHNLTVKRSENSLDFHFITAGPVIGRIYFYVKSKTVPPDTKQSALNFTADSQAYRDTTAGLTHRFLLQGLLPHTAYYITLFSGANQDCEHKVLTRSLADAALSLASPRVGSPLTKPLTAQRVSPSIVTLALKKAQALATANKPVSLLVWISIALGLITLFTLGTPAVIRLQRAYIRMRDVPNRWAFLTRKKKDRGTWGRVMSSLTMKSIQGAMISLYQGEDKKLIDRSFTDDRGLYGFFVDPGIFTVVAQHSGYVFPPVLMPFAYQGGAVKVEGTNGTTHLDLVMDPAMLTDTRLQWLEETLLQLEPYRIPSLLVAGVLSLVAFIFDLAPFSLVPLVIVGLLVHHEYKRRNEAHACFTFMLPSKELITFAQVVFRTWQGRVAISKVINHRGKVFITLPAGTYYAEITTFPIPGRPAILHNTIKIELKRGRRMAHLDYTI